MKARRPGALERAKRMAGATCTRHRRGDLVGWLPVDNDRHTRWAVFEVYRCARCGQDMSPRIARGTIRRTQREALLAYGLPQADVDQYPGLKPESVPPSSAVAAPLTCWPFPVSAHQDRESSRGNAPPLAPLESTAIGSTLSA